MLTDFPYWQSRTGGGYLWPNCTMGNGNPFWGGSTWIWTYPRVPSGAYRFIVTAYNPNPYSMEVKWTAFTNPHVSGPPASTIIAAYSSEVIAVTWDGSLVADTTMGEVWVNGVKLGDVDGEFDAT